jgi:DNA-binding IclR family transcriptional regulator
VRELRVKKGTIMTDSTPPNLRILKIFEVIADAGGPLTPSEINEQLDWPKQSLHRLCQTLIAEGYLVKQARRLHPTKRLLSLAAGLAQHATGQTTRHQILQNIAREAGETVNFVRPEIKGMIYADRVETNWPFQVLLPVGTHVPFHCTASGKTYLASLPPKKRRVLLDSLDLRAYTEHTHTSTETLEDELQRISKDGFALDLEEFHDGMVAIAVPVLDSRRRYVAALAIHGPKQRFDFDEAMARRGLLAESAKIISQTFGY